MLRDLTLYVYRVANSYDKSKKILKAVCPNMDIGYLHLISDISYFTGLMQPKK